MIPSAIADKPELDTSFTSTGAKLFHHQEAMQALRDGKGMPISCWVAPTDVCNAKCSFCSVGERVGDVLRFSQIEEFLGQLVPLGLKSVTFSGGGNPLIYKCKETGKGINDLIERAHDHFGLEVAMITNGMPLVEYREVVGWLNPSFSKDGVTFSGEETRIRKSWRNLKPENLDKLTWCRISMAGLDHNHKEQEVYVPDFDPTKTALGFSWIMSDSYEEPTHKHGWVSTPEDVKTPGGRFVDAEERLPWIESKIKEYVEKHRPRYVRLLTNCLQPERIPQRHALLQGMADRIDQQIVFSQNKPPRQPKKCFKVLTRPCLNADGWVYACDSVVLNRTAGHKFGSVWRICTGDKVGDLMQNPEKYQMPDNVCAGCVFADQVDLINAVVNGAETPLPEGNIDHVNFV
jgi:MoaA/NifB/PqqE/SkfB family radical SAM enzyme